MAAAELSLAIDFSITRGDAAHRFAHSAVSPDASRVLAVCTGQSTAIQSNEGRIFRVDCYGRSCSPQRCPIDCECCSAVHECVPHWHAVSALRSDHQQPLWLRRARCSRSLCTQASAVAGSRSVCHSILAHVGHLFLSSDRLRGPRCPLVILCCSSLPSLFPSPRCLAAFLSSANMSRHAPAFDSTGDSTVTRVGTAAASSHSAPRKTPAYMQPTASNTLPEYANTEAEQIRASFTTGNYRLIAHLPTEIKAHHVSEATANRIDDNITSAYFVAPHGSYRKLGTKDSLFSTFDYKPEEYSLASTLLRQERENKEGKRLEAHPQPFLYSTPRPLLINSLAGATPPEEAAGYVEPYASAEDHARRASYAHAQGLLHGPFVPTPASRSIGDDKVIRLKLPTILQELMSALDRDWGDLEFQIYADAEEIIILQFTVASIDNPAALSKYMSMFMRTSEIISKFHLVKLVELWNHRNDDGTFLYFAVKPPWVRRETRESFEKLHPERLTASEERRRIKEAAAAREEEEKQQQQQRQIQAQQHPMLLPGSGASTARQSTTASGAGAGAGRTTLSTADREQMEQLMASFDAGLQGRKTGSAGASQPLQQTQSRY